MSKYEGSDRPKRKVNPPEPGKEQLGHKPERHRLELERDLAKICEASLFRLFPGSEKVGEASKRLASALIETGNEGELSNERAEELAAYLRRTFLEGGIGQPATDEPPPSPTPTKLSKTPVLLNDYLIYGNKWSKGAPNPERAT